ncbi:hypothetical protein KCP78_15255 [Salmonella enterica subsp. enterica]|nr:hypothetical protein KCP78_15255 [Salmonella enterica subsp. enterica]
MWGETYEQILLVSLCWRCFCWPVNVTSGAYFFPIKLAAGHGSPTPSTPGGDSASNAQSPCTQMNATDKIVGVMANWKQQATAMRVWRRNWRERSLAGRSNALI